MFHVQVFSIFQDILLECLKISFLVYSKKNLVLLKVLKNREERKTGRIIEQFEI